MSASSVSSCKTPDGSPPVSSGDTSSSSSSQESLLAQLNLPLPDPFYSMNQINSYYPQGVVGFAERTLVYRGLFCPFGLSRMGLQVTVPIVLRPHNLGATPSIVSQINMNRFVKDLFILRVEDEVYTQDRLWVVFRYWGPSLRELYPHGAESHFLVVVRSLFITVHALVSIHGADMIHGQVNLGHIYKKQDFPAYQIGFEATIYESGQEQESERGFKRALKICEWASAPEVWFNMNNKACHTPASDIWQVGVTALELALGDLHVRNRQELDALIATAKTRWVHGIFGNVEFKSFLQMCLNYNPTMRPTSWTLLHHNLFRANNCGLGSGPGPGPGLN